MILSIITPTLNCQSSLAKMIDSISAQSFENIDHIIVDGGSTDGTLQLIEREPGIKLISEPDEGVFDAMNKGLKAASGDWIYFLGADDYFADAEVLSDLAPMFESDLDVIYGDIFDEYMQHIYDGKFDQLRIRDRNISHQAIFFRRNVFDQAGLFNKSYETFADWDHNMRWMFNKSIHSQYVDRIIAVYGGFGLSYHKPDRKFKRDRLYRYLSYGKDDLTFTRYWSTWLMESVCSVLTLNLKRLMRAFNLAFGS